MLLGDKVKLVLFNGLMKGPARTVISEDYWKLIGQTGTIIQDPTQTSLYASFSKEKRVLVKFDKNIKSFNLVCHNVIANSLWILETDLVKVD